MMAEAITGVNTQQVSAAGVTQRVQTQLTEDRAVLKRQEEAQKQQADENRQLRQVQPNAQIEAAQPAQATETVQPMQPTELTSAAEVNLTDNARLYAIEQKVNRSQELTSDEMNYIRANDTDLYNKAMREEELLAAERTGSAVASAAHIQ